jgi:hypothetical protein
MFSHSFSGEVLGPRGNTFELAPAGGRSSIITVVPAFLGARNFLIWPFIDK